MNFEAQDKVDHKRLHEGGLSENLEDVRIDLMFAGKEMGEPLDSSEENEKDLDTLLSRGITEKQILAILETSYGLSNQFRHRYSQITGYKEEHRKKVELAENIRFVLHACVAFLDFLDSQVGYRVLSAEEAERYKKDIGVIEINVLSKQTGFMKARPDLFRGGEGQ